MKTHPLAAASMALVLVLAFACGAGGTSPAVDVPTSDVPEADLPGTDLAGQDLVGQDLVGQDIPPSDQGPDAPPGFDDHTVPSVADFAAFRALALADYPAQVKFNISNFQSDSAYETRLTDSSFYNLHDEWAWFRLMNGQPIAGYMQQPLQGASFPTVQAIIDWAKKQAELPLDLLWVDDGARLYSPLFYRHAFDWQVIDQANTHVPRFFGVGSVLHYPPDETRNRPEELWLFELEYGDKPDVATLEKLFARLEEALPPDVGSRLLWLVRSTVQQGVADEMKAQGHPLAARTATYDDLVVRGKVEVYNPGIAAGNLVIVKKGEFAPASLTPQDIVVLEEIPDDIPPVAAIITSVPQTPLAHIALLARARRTPNVYWGAASTSDPFVVWDYYRKRVIVKATPEGVKFRILTTAEWEEYLAKGKVPAVAVPQIDLSNAPYTFDLAIGGMSQMLGTVPLVGGKSGGFMALLERPEALPVPDRPIGVTIRAFAEHMKRTVPPIDPALVAQLSAQQDARARYLVLEGEDRFRAVYAALPINLEWLDAYKAGTLPSGFHGLPEYPLLQQALAAGGVRKLVRATPILPATLATIRAAIEDRFAFLAPAQALRFRSSSTAEDIEGFNGAGLYESNTGWLFPEAAPAGDANKTIERALLKTWDSYWLFGAFEERRNAGVDHLSGNMGVAVHPRFDDDKELSNGVITLELARLPAGPRTVLSVNVQKGALSVTNPPIGSNALPEVDVVRSTEPGKVERVRPSTEVAVGEVLLTDAELTTMHASLADLASDWLDARNARHNPQQANSTVTIDLEFKRMRGDWPIRADGATDADRIVYKQARTLEAPMKLPADLASDHPVPTDLLSSTLHVDQRVCNGPALQFDTYEFYTDPLTAADVFPYAVAPFHSYVRYRFVAAVPALGIPAGKVGSLLHTDLVSQLHPGMDEGGPFVLEFVPKNPTTAGFDLFRIEASGAWKVVKGYAVHEGVGPACTVSTKAELPANYLERLMNGS